MPRPARAILAVAVVVAIASVPLAGCAASGGDRASTTVTSGADHPDGSSSGADEHARQVNACKEEYGVVETAVEAFNVQVGRYPTSAQDLVDGTATDPSGRRVLPVLKALPTYWDVSPNGRGELIPRAGVTLPDGCRR